MSELTALVLTVQVEEPTSAPAHLGRAVYAWLMRQIEAHDAALAHQIHDSDGPKPFTCSGLIGGRRQDRASRLYQPDHPAWLRLTGLTPAISAHLERLNAAPPASIDLDGHFFPVTTVTLDEEEHQWAGQADYQTLAAPYLLAKEEPAYRVPLRFASPTTFRSGGLSHPMPQPDFVFGSLLNRWNAFSPVQLPAEVRRFAAECVALSRYRLRTRAVPFKAGVVQMGCVGRARYAVVRRDKYWASLLNLLAVFSFYSGVGYQTTVGLGQTRRTQ